MTTVKSRDEIIQWLDKYYRNYYDVQTIQGRQPLVLRADLHVSNQKYFVFKKNVLWEANCHEYIFVHSVEELTEEVYRQCQDKMLQEAESLGLVKPGPNHMYTYLNLVIVADHADDAALRAARKCRIYKSFRFSLQGWMEVHTAIFDRSRGRTITNRGGRENAKLFKHI